jgi:phosphoglycerol transferase MdoB-like AlkP superfamily enzyme
MNGDMFNWSKWYRVVRFQQMWFNSQFQHEKLPNCDGAFWGTCDAAIAEWMGRLLERRKSNPEFLYWVTLNSHLPVPVPAPLPAAASCSFAQSLAQQPKLCSWYQLIANVHRSVADLAMAKLGRRTVFAIVGDHAPPFSQSALRDRFSPTVVPYVLLIPRDSAGGSHSPSPGNE